MIKLFST